MPNSSNAHIESRIHQSGLGPYYDDGKVLGDIEWNPETKVFAIHTWTSHETGKGHTTESLKWIRDVLGATHIHIVGAGFVEDGIPNESLRYWLHLGKHGWIDSIEDDEGLDVPFKKNPVNEKPDATSFEP